MEENFTMVAKTLFGFEDILANELTQLGAMKVEKGVRNVSFVGDRLLHECLVVGSSPVDSTSY